MRRSLSRVHTQLDRTAKSSSSREWMVRTEKKIRILSRPHPVSVHPSLQLESLLNAPNHLFNAEKGQLYICETQRVHLKVYNMTSLQ